MQAVVAIELGRQTPDVELKAWVREQRIGRGWTQQELADRAGIERVEVNALENGRNKGTTARIQNALRRAFGAAALPHELFETPPEDGDDLRPIVANLPGWREAEAQARQRAPWFDELDWEHAGAFSALVPPEHVTPEFVLALATAAREGRVGRR